MKPIKQSSPARTTFLVVYSILLAFLFVVAGLGLYADISARPTGLVATVALLAPYFVAIFGLGIALELLEHRIRKPLPNRKAFG